MNRVVLDANVIVSALIRPQGPPGHIIGHIAARDVELVLTPDITSEIGRAARYEKVRKAMSFSEDELELWLTALEVLAIHVEPTRRVSVVGTDPEDDKYVEAALEGLAQFIVTGDRHLLALEAFEEIRIVRPAAFLREIRRLDRESPGSA